MQREVAVHDHARRIAGLQLGRGVAANIRFKRDVVDKTSRELETIAKDDYAATQDLQHNDFIPEAISRSDAEVSEIGPGDLDFRCKAIVRDTWVIIQSCLSARIYSDHGLKACFNAVRMVDRVGCLLREDLRCLLCNG